jgi:hypothetical protein
MPARRTPRVPGAMRRDLDIATLSLLLLLPVLLIIACAPGKTVRETDLKRTGPAISLSADVWDFGTLKRGEKNAGEIRLTNEGSDTLSVSLHPTCDCLEAWMESDRIAPGQSLPIHLTYMGDEIKDMTTKTLYVDSNDEINPRIAVKVTGRVITGDGPHLVASPDPLLFDPEDPRYPEADLTISNIGRKHLEIIEIRCFGCEVDYWRPASLSGSGHAPGEEPPASSPVYGLKVRRLDGWTGARWIEIETNDPVNTVKKVGILEL